MNKKKTPNNIEDLLSLVKMDKSAAVMNISSVNVNEMLEIVLKRLKPIAQKKNVELLFESFRPVVAEIDEVKFTLVISNLVENAIKYNVSDGWVHVSLNADYQYFYVLKIQVLEYRKRARILYLTDFTGLIKHVQDRPEAQVLDLQLYRILFFYIMAQ